MTATYDAHSLAALEAAPVRTSREALPVDADAQVLATLSKMSEYVLEDAHFPLIQQTATRLKAQIEAQGAVTPYSVGQALFEEANRKLTFTLDQNTAEAHGLEDRENIVEVLTRPADVELLYQRQQAPVLGDCDDFSMYVLAVAKALGALGLPISHIRFVTIAAQPGNPDYSHVYTRINVNDQTIAIDASHGAEAGWEAINQASRVQEVAPEGAMTQGTMLAMLGIGLGLYWLLRG